ncbi:hypothetical protein ACHAXA_000212 [Cyclostephanos tholiformis]|uniref:Endonuclease/exonuclease/phosphatase domain-containing protein n=1 Tax=Cyclostephanos tholiformis TaxID=382380 RepID=A0ABD3R287_9STRA
MVILGAIAEVNGTPRLSVDLSFSSMRAARVVATTFFIRPLLPFSPTFLFFSRTNHGTNSVSSVAAMSTSSSTSPPIKNGVRIVSYNLLSSKLARPSHFTHAEPDHLEFDYRLRIILDKLDAEMNRGFGGNEDSQHWIPPTIFALQEVCYPFASALHTFFAQRGYHFVTGLYGKQFNGYMGVGLAYPLRDFATVNVDICRLSDERVGGWPRENVDTEGESGEKTGLREAIQRLTAQFGSIAFQSIQAINNRIVKRLGYKSSEKSIDPWEMSENRHNVLLTVTLCHREGGFTFSISNYHMPCAFFAPAVMNIHTDMVSKRVQDLAAESWKSIRGCESSNQTPQEGNKTIPYILAGDFNILPDSAQYKILTTGELEKSDPTYPPKKYGQEWKIESLPMDSAYALDGSEPEFTNYAHTRDDIDPFIGTLDYIFLSKKESTNFHGENESWEWWKVHRVQKLPHKEDSGGPFPNAKEPSDHLLISADLELTSV